MRVLCLCLFIMMIISCSTNKWDQKRQLSLCFKQTASNIKSCTEDNKPYYNFLYSGFLKEYTDDFKDIHLSQKDLYTATDSLCNFIEKNSISHSESRTLAAKFNTYIDNLTQQLKPYQHKTKGELKLYKIDTCNFYSSNSFNSDLLKNSLVMRARALEALLQKQKGSHTIEYHPQAPQLIILSNSLPTGEEYTAEIFPAIIKKSNKAELIINNKKIERQQGFLFYEKTVKTKGKHTWEGVLIDSSLTERGYKAIEHFPLSGEFWVY